MASRWIYSFQEDHGISPEHIREILGGKGAGLVEMTQMGLPVPPGFILTTEVCNAFYAQDKTYPEGLKPQVIQGLKAIEKAWGSARFGDAKNPLLLSVRSGAKASMPGMMDTILNLGLNDQTVEGLKNQTQDARFAYDSYRRFIQMYSNVVLGLDLHSFEEVLTQYKAVRKVTEDGNLSAIDLISVIEAYKEKVLNMTDQPFPQDVETQLWGAIGAILGTWMNPRAVSYRKLYHISEKAGTAVVIQTMVFGNQGNNSATGVAFTRNPSTGTKEFYGEYLLKAQGEDVVAGIRTPEPLAKSQKQFISQRSLEEVMPQVYQELVHLQDILEQHYHDMQDFEFTIQQGKLWLLQTRRGKRTAEAALRIALDMVDEGLISQQEALYRFEPLALEHLLHPRLDSNHNLEMIGQGLPASPGAAVGRVVLTADDCASQAAQGENLILVREETSPEDIHGMAVAKGILTNRGGMTSHAAVVARGMGLPCITGAENLRIHIDSQKFSIGSVSLKAGDYITLDGSTGQIFQGSGDLQATPLSKNFNIFMNWADNTRRLQIRANAETPADAQKAKEFGAQGIGLCRTEHMFFDTERILAVREMILASTPEGREKALKQIIPMQKEDFLKLFKIMHGLPITIRLLDPPLHEFLPRSEGEVDQLARSTHLSPLIVRQRISELTESNPMLGHRGCRLGITYPEIYAGQAQALFEAAADCERVTKECVKLEIMIPLVALTGELMQMKQLIEAQAAAVRAQTKCTLQYQVGTMIELPRAALKAGKIAMITDFISFGTNDLTQTTFGLSRDDASSFINTYRNKGILERDPFISLDKSGVGELITIASQRARAVNPGIKIGVCGEHAGDALSIDFFEELELDYVSCSPYRVPLARLASAQAVLKKTLLKSKG